MLVNNAGIMGLPKRTLNSQGFELQMATNYFGPFLLTALLIPLMPDEIYDDRRNPIIFLIAQAAGRDFLEQYLTRLIVRLDLCIKGIRYAECLLDGALRPTLAMILLG